MTQKTCFVVTAIGQIGSPERIQADKVLNYLIEPVCNELGFSVIRVDRETVNGDINESIINHLKNDELVIADLTGYNANAFYEFGYRQALNLPVIPIIEHTQRLPFDVVSKRTVFYDTDVSTIEDSKLRLRDMILDFESFIMPNKRDEAKSEFDVINEKLDKIIKQVTSSKSESSLSLNSSDLLQHSEHTRKIQQEVQKTLDKAKVTFSHYEQIQSPLHNQADTE